MVAAPHVPAISRYHGELVPRQGGIAIILRSKGSLASGGCLP